MLFKGECFNVDIGKGEKYKYSPSLFCINVLMPLSYVLKEVKSLA